MTVDYDAPRRVMADREESIDDLAMRRETPATAVLDVDEGEAPDFYALPGADFLDEDLVVRVIPKQADEFTCGSCFLVHHRSRLARGGDGQSICTDCA